MERWFVENMIRCSGLPFVADAACETLEDIRYHYLGDQNYSLSLRELKYRRGELYGRTIVNFIADLLVGPVNFGYKEIAFFVYACRTLGIPPIHVTYAHQERVCVEKIGGKATLGRPNAYSINGIVYDLPIGQSAFEFVKRCLVHRIPEETRVLCEFDNETFKVYKSKTEDHRNIRAFVEWAGESTCPLLKEGEGGSEAVERFNVLVEPYQSRYEGASVHGAVYDACRRQKRIGKFRATTSRTYFDDFEATSEILNYVKKVGNYKVTIERESAKIGYAHGIDAGNAMAAYNLFALEAGKPTIRFEYELIKKQYRGITTGPLSPPVNRVWDLNGLVTRHKREPTFPQEVPLYERPSISQDRYEEITAG